MPYIDGKRVTNEEWTARYGSLRKFHTGPNGENPAADPALDEETHAPEAKPARSPRSAKSATAAIANAMGTTSAEVTAQGIDPGASTEATEEAAAKAAAFKERMAAGRAAAAEKKAAAAAAGADA